jgi:hypothetical protein
VGAAPCIENTMRVMGAAPCTENTSEYFMGNDIFLTPPLYVFLIEVRVVSFGAGVTSASLIHVCEFSESFERELITYDNTVLFSSVLKLSIMGLLHQSAFKMGSH